MFKSLLSLLLSLNILFGSLGVSIYKHTCKVFNQTETSFFHPKSCCETTNDKNLSIDVSCCSSQVTRFEIPRVGLSLDIDPIQFIGLTSVKGPRYLINPLGEDLLTKRQPIQIPPLIEEDLQSWNQVYNI
tara:strand:- start:144 stop:533 length:390 start_codon:yes stop_codon:yes gene_type:complete